jgi:RecA/RadA recombinase
MSDFLKTVIKEVGNEYASIVNDGVEAGDVSSFIDTGSYILNGLLSGSLYGGLPSNKITALAGESATGKTYFLMGIVRNFLESNPTAQVAYFESESAITQQMILDRETRDMTRAQVLKAAFRVLTLKLGRAKVPMVVTNHTYDVVGSMFPTKEMGGGSGLKYAASSIVYLSRKKEKDGTEVIGNIIHCKNHKSRLTKENKMVDVRLTYDKGLDKYYGLLELAEKYEIFKKVSTRFELPDGSKQFGKTILNDPTTYFTEDIMQQLETAANTEFKYGE